MESTDNGIGRQGRVLSQGVHRFLLFFNFISDFCQIKFACIYIASYDSVHDLERYW